MVQKCQKRTFNSVSEAEECLNTIHSTSSRETIPIRVYECERCGKYHLTSKTKRVYQSNVTKKRNLIQTRNKYREQKFIELESEFWIKRFEKRYSKTRN